ncbi:VacJ family lipoprotein [Candidatus Parcubacteria bacterium]|nr:VacJ family lipoprotein [Patescibacteria group bacterium]MBU4309033.1 VacJ family lipoprotein [Patescibacteria group bacterium]MBU4432372.1 VacJ family lipoprotein [Patescibacteria group bacterium]MBU4577394.1 VacJ family lipoprotein [Patescibacteria group bacterium]MCG2697082.1 VacJ family lipoprotein [Candidatus Parcubacteria bacterium]
MREKLSATGLTVLLFLLLFLSGCATTKVANDPLGNNQAFNSRSSDQSKEINKDAGDTPEEKSTSINIAPIQIKEMNDVTGDTTGEKQVALNISPIQTEETDEVADGTFGDEQAFYGDAYDPLEELNRATHYANDKFVFKPLYFPISDSWEENVHDKVKDAIKNIAHCASTPVRVVGDLMQLKVEKAIVDFWSIFNLVTLCTVDIYTPDDKFDDENVSQGLAKNGIPEGPAITWPIFGPTNLRNTVGAIADTFLNPQTYIGFPANIIIATIEAINDPTQKRAYREFESMSVDQYASVRDGFRTNFNKKLKK